ncbi:MAG: DJ-1 family glyoxalase III [bacterium]
MYKSVLVPISQGTEDIEAVVIIDLLRRANYNVLVAGDAEIITCSNGVRIIPDKHIDEIPDNTEFDAIIIPGGMKGIDNLDLSEKLEFLLERHNKAGRLIGAICAAPLLLLSKQLLPEGVALTSHPDIKDSFAKFNYREENVVISGNLITSRGVGTAIDFALAIIESLKGKELAEQIAKKIVY